MPCFNPTPGWVASLSGKFLGLQAQLIALGLEANLTLVNDGSTRNVEAENLRQLVENVPSTQIIQYPANRGKGHALRQGVAATDADFYLLTDIDFPYTLPSMVRVAQVLLEKGGIAAGNRDTGYYSNVPFFRRMLSQGLRWLLLRVIQLPVSDSQCGLKGFDRAGRTVFLATTIDRFLFDLEFLMLAGGQVPVVPVPVELRAGVVFSKVGWKILLTEGRNFLWLFLRRGRAKEGEKLKA